MSIKITSRYPREGEKLIQRFKRLCLRAGLLKELKRRRSYEKPSTRRRREASENRRAALRAARRLAAPRSKSR